MKFIHAVVFDKDEFENSNYDTGNWNDLTDGDYVVHCLYSVDNEEIIIHEDNCHQPVETIIESFYGGIEFCGHDAIETKAFIIVDNGCSYSSDAVKAKLIAGNYGEVL